MADHLPTPTRTPPPPAITNISTEINVATRKQHTELNRLIIDRLPLGLPPHASDPALLGRGLAAFARIFFAFESVWKDIEDGKHALNRLDPSQAHKYDVVSFLSFLRPAGMSRSERLRLDLGHINQKTGIDFRPTKYDEVLMTSIRARVNAEPHALIAHAWVMYMAIFSGGRWIRQQLSSPGPGFWPLPPQTEKTDIEDRLHMPGFSFLSFDGTQDGEDIKADFKSRLEEAEELLTANEREEVVQAAQALFEECIDLVKDIDRRIVTQSFVPLLGIAALLAALLVMLLGFYWYDNHAYLA
ncbi:heme oxygenase-like protein [Teratosphaeria nubilosa]|uniref:Heme oxygenase-like protein n=1 Tax=Teratosphaeria nubilosa TaxID=161662 RepID=A0A6G1LKE1_9PEZI|nr:heme oxygenase-like protein [Teratosphaeria nubilosa]